MRSLRITGLFTLRRVAPRKQPERMGNREGSGRRAKGRKKNKN
jgi:hypothetical protein